MTTNQKIETSREVRQWVMLGIKAGSTAVMAYALIPEFRTFVDRKVYDFKHRSDKK